MAVVQKCPELTLEVKNVTVEHYQSGEKNLAYLKYVLEIPRSTDDSVIIIVRDRGNTENIK